MPDGGWELHQRRGGDFWDRHSELPGRTASSEHLTMRAGGLICRLQLTYGPVGCSVCSHVVPRKRQPVIDFAVTVPYKYRWLEGINEENASTTTSPSAADMRDGDKRKNQRSNRLAGNSKCEGVYRLKGNRSCGCLSDLFNHYWRNSCQGHLDPSM